MRLFTCAISAVMSAQAVAYTEVISYQYDDLNRLTSAQSGRGMEQIFTLDEVHNRLSTIRSATNGHAPTARSDRYILTTNTTLTVPAPGVLANDIDPNNHALTISDYTDAAHGDVTLNDNGLLSYTPDTGYVGEDYFTYRVSNGSQPSNYAMVNLTVSPSHPYPVAEDDSLTTLQGSTSSLYVLANDIDSSASGLTITQISYSGQGSATNFGNRIAYQAPDRFIGQETLRYTVSDGHNGTDTAFVTITVNDANFAPSITNETVWATSGKTITIPVLANDTDLDGDVLQITQISYSGAGIASHNGQTISFRLPSGVAAQTIGYTVSDGTVTRNGTVTVYLRSNDSPTATDDSFTTLEDIAITLDVLSNDTDPNGDPLTIISKSTPSHGALSVVGDQLLYTPSKNYHGSDSFTYTIRDTQHLTSQATVTLTIEEDLTNDPPIALDDHFSTQVNTPKLLDVLANDTDADRDTLHIWYASWPLGRPQGSVSKSGNKILFTPRDGFTGTVRFYYEATDYLGGTDRAYVTVHVYDPGATIVPILNLLLLDEEETQ